MFLLPITLTNGNILRTGGIKVNKSRYKQCEDRQSNLSKSSEMHLHQKIKDTFTLNYFQYVARIFLKFWLHMELIGLTVFRESQC